MTSPVPPGPVATLPIFPSVAAVFRTVLLENLGYFPRAVLAPLLLSLLLLLLQIRFGTPMVQTEGQPPPTPATIDFLLSLAGMVPYVIFAVAWHRLVLLGPQQGLPDLQPSWRRRHFHFLGYMLLLALIAGLVLLCLGIAAGLLLPQSLVQAEPDAAPNLLVLAVSLLLLLLVGGLAMRFSFVLPARALDETYGLSESWRQTRGQGLRILTVFLIVQAIIAIPSLIIVTLIGAGTGVMSLINEVGRGHELEAGILLIGVLPVLILGFLASYLATALGVTVLSQAFKTCSGWLPPATPQDMEPDRA